MVRKVAALHLLYMGDLNRYKAKFDAEASKMDGRTPQPGDGTISEQAAASTAYSFYNRAKTVFPHEGKVFH